MYTGRSSARIPQYLAHKPHQQLRNSLHSSSFCGAGYGQEVLRFQFAHGNVAQGREKIGVQTEQDLLTVSGRKLSGLVFVPFQGNIFEGIGLLRDPAGNDGFFMRSGVYALGKQTLGFLAALMGVFQ
jgi:hypothetical protein